MALNKEVFRTRALSAVIFVIIMLGGLLWNRWSFLALFSIIHFGCWWEYLKLVEKIYGTSFGKNIKFGCMLPGYAIMLSFCGSRYMIDGYGLRENLMLPLSFAGLIFLVIGIFSPAGRSELKKHLSLEAFGIAVLGWFYISLSWGMMIGLQDYSMKVISKAPDLIYVPTYAIPFILIASVWINDTMAYLVGSVIGKTPFSKISPKKTWEGTIGGALLCIAVMGFVAYYLFNCSWKAAIAIPMIAATIGTAGDLLESRIKRMANVKDSGTMMPGHGGFMDRFDSLLLASPFVYLYVRWLV